ncbi:TetR/AcrR family transcriptional regulator [Cellulomonas sp. PhB143]|uniref:TetR/AcrR family transcriptional regulator n=1 Tax=Cellulomonas sp. PhB143 TaxID=2485186 RepID=UPI000F4978E3|nr:TetR/AcrR family transcriptional regulator [Cellulomonas sp. PhB143]ROS76477.1 TetR family transcriptional regulator [Cellulomonas sp. PhB143]
MTAETVEPVDGVPRRGYAKGRRTRAEIVDAATTLFGQVGYHSASLREIAARVGLSHPGLLHHFATKEALLEEVLAHRDEQDAQVFLDDDAEGRGYVENLVRLVRHNQERPGIVELYAVLSAEATSPDHPAHAYFERRYARIVGRFAQEAERWVTDGSVPASTDTVGLARAMIAVMDGLQVQWLLARGTRSSFDMADAFGAHLRLMLRGAG